MDANCGAFGGPLLLNLENYCQSFPSGSLKFDVFIAVMSDYVYKS